MAVDLALCRQRVLSLLLAAQAANLYGGVAGEVSVYPSSTEINDAILQGDQLVCLAIIETPGHPYASQFLAASPNLVSGAMIPAHVGAIGDVTVDGIESNLASSRAEILEIRANPTLYPNVGKWHFIEGNFIFHTGTNVNVMYPVLTLTGAPQAHTAYTAADVAAGMMLLLKDGGDAQVFNHYTNVFAMQETAIRRKDLVIPETSQFERMAA